eukprot:Pgem_evm1s17769
MYHPAPPSKKRLPKIALIGSHLSCEISKSIEFLDENTAILKWTDGKVYDVQLIDDGHVG